MTGKYNFKRKICVVSGSRADYGILYWLLKEIVGDPSLQLSIVATGMHLSLVHGLTYRAIEQDGFAIKDKVEMPLSDDSPPGVVKSLGAGTIGFSQVLEKIRPDILVIQGDRFEMLAAAQAALIMKVPVAHIHGGESTEGAVDEAIRHAITKMAHIHFVAADAYRQKVIQLGENPRRVFNYGAPGLDYIRRAKLLDRKSLEDALNIKFGRQNFLITYHPATLSDRSPSAAISSLLKALNHFPEASMIFTKPNADVHSSEIGRWIDGYAAKHSPRVQSFISLGQIKYLSVMKHADVVIGNSSSGIVEAPAMKKPVVNVGDRQRGRLKSVCVIDCQENETAIKSAIDRALSPRFKQLAERTSSLYGESNASYRIKERLKKLNLRNVLMKKFYMLEKKGRLN